LVVANIPPSPQADRATTKKALSKKEKEGGKAYGRKHLKRQTKSLKHRGAEGES